MLDFMRERNRRAFLVIDGIEGLYKRPRDCPLADRVYRQLHTMGELDGANRPVMTVLTGSAAVLRTLLYSVPGYDLKAAYPCYLRWGSLNDRKYPASTLWPVTAPDDFAHAVLCISSESANLLALASGCSVPRAGVGAAGPEAAVGIHDAPPTAGAAAKPTAVGTQSDGDGVDAAALRHAVIPEDLAWACARCSGLASEIAGAPRCADEAWEHRLTRMLATEPAYLGPFRRLFNAWAASVAAAGRDVASAAGGAADASVCTHPTADAAAASVCAFGMPLEEHEDVSVWHQLMEAGAIFFDDAPMARSVHFLHPSDAGALLRHLRRPAAAAEA
jgi:hypothetical protein